MAPFSLGVPENRQPGSRLLPLESQGGKGRVTPRVLVIPKENGGGSVCPADDADGRSLRLGRDKSGSGAAFPTPIPSASLRAGLGPGTVSLLPILYGEAGYLRLHGVGKPPQVVGKFPFLPAGDAVTVQGVPLEIPDGEGSARPGSGVDQLHLFPRLFHLKRGSRPTGAVCLQGQGECVHLFAPAPGEHIPPQVPTRFLV